MAKTGQKPTRDKLVDQLLWFLHELKYDAGTDPFLKEEASRLEGEMIAALEAGKIE